MPWTINNKMNPRTRSVLQDSQVFVCFSDLFPPMTEEKRSFESSIVCLRLLLNRWRFPDRAGQGGQRLPGSTTLPSSPLTRPPTTCPGSCSTRRSSRTTLPRRERTFCTPRTLRHCSPRHCTRPSTCSPPSASLTYPAPPTPPVPRCPPSTLVSIILNCPLYLPSSLPFPPPLLLLLLPPSPLQPPLLRLHHHHHHHHHLL